MGTGYLIAALALSNMQYAVIARQPALLNNNVYVSNEVSVELLTASSGNPWAIPDPDEGYSRGSSRQQLPVKRNQQTYITPEELQSLERLPEEEGFYGSERAPLKRGEMFNGRTYSVPGYGSRGYRGWDNYPSGGLYGRPLYPGINPLIDPYGYSPYRGTPYNRISPFMY